MTNMKYNKNINALVEIFFERIAEIKPAHNPPMPYNISEKPNCTDESFKTLYTYPGNDMLKIIVNTIGMIEITPKINIIMLSFKNFYPNKYSCNKLFVDSSSE